MNTVLRSQGPRPPIEVEAHNEDHDNEDNNILPAMVTRLPKPKDIVLKEVKDFDGSPANLSLFNTQIRNALNKLDIPAYYGGSVSGNEEEGYSYVAANTPEGKGNYRLGEKLCSGISNKFTGPASQWGELLGGGVARVSVVFLGAAVALPLPFGCGARGLGGSGDGVVFLEVAASAYVRVSVLVALHIPDGVVEVSLYDLLVQQFDSTIDAQQAELELEAYRWNPFDKKALGVVPFRGHVTRLCTRAGKAAWGSKCKAIRNTFPDWLKKQIKMTKRGGLLGRWHTADECRKKDGSKEASKDKDGKDRKKKQCQFCGFEGYEIGDCRKMKAAQQQLQQHQPFQAQSGQQQQNQYNRRLLPVGFQQANQQGFQQANQQGFEQANQQGFQQAN
ncbi:hypothetical protein BGX38DRAFT_1272351 [Terfezia claveryi]|nr:hypothetical protein BGX38DRAFT_1280276 [Terfezia claveryi]KAF8442531.1 hypothetical protein BGX38DRAFT_1272351 [Terfezia claveryi]